MKYFRLIFLFAMFFGTAQATPLPEEGIQQPFDHLTPEFSIIGDPELSDWWIAGGYHRLVTRVLKPAYSKNVWARVIVLPSFGKEQAIGFRK